VNQRTPGEVVFEAIAWRPRNHGEQYCRSSAWASLPLCGETIVGPQSQNRLSLKICGIFKALAEDRGDSNDARPTTAHRGGRIAKNKGVSVWRKDPYATGFESAKAG